MAIAANALMILGFVFGLYEFLDWFAGKPGFVGGWILENLTSFFLLQNPFLATYTILPAAWSQPIRNRFRDGLLSRWQLVTHPWAHRIAPWFQGLCYFLLAHQIREIFLLAGKPFVPTSSGAIFVWIIILTYLVQYVLRNLPVVLELRERFLAADAEGLYALKHDQFILKEILGHSETLTLIEGPCQHVKERASLWFAFRKGVIEFYENATNLLEVKVLHVNYSWWAAVTSTPEKIQLQGVSLAGLESLPQIGKLIHQECIPKLRQQIREQREFQDIDAKLEDILLNRSADNFARTLEAATDRLVNGQLIRKQIDSLRTLLLDTVGRQISQGARYSLYGGLYLYDFWLDKVTLAPDFLKRLDDFETEAKAAIAEFYRQAEDKRRFMLDVVKLTGETLDKTQGIVSRSLQEEVLKGVLGVFIKNVDDSTLQSLQHETRKRVEQATDNNGKRKLE